MKHNRPVKTAGYNFSTQAKRRARRKIDAEERLDCATFKPFGLRQQIAAANSESEIKSHLANGTIRFTSASAHTRRQWSATAKRRLAQLGGAK